MGKCIENQLVIERQTVFGDKKNRTTPLGHKVTNTVVVIFSRYTDD